MAKLVYGMNMSLGGYVDHRAFVPDATLFANFIEQTRNAAGALRPRPLRDHALLGRERLG